MRSKAIVYDKYYYTSVGRQKVILNELFDANKAVDRLLNLIDFTTDGTEANVIRQRLIQKGIKPTLMNIKRHFLKALLNAFR